MAVIWYDCPDPNCGLSYKTKDHICKGRGNRRHDPKICRKRPSNNGGFGIPGFDKSH